MTLAAAFALVLIAAQPGMSDKTIPGQPGTNGSGGDAAPITQPAPAPATAPAQPAVPFLHPIITEVLFAVPSGPTGDANRDGRRESAGDEFIELTNPHDKPIQLFGYTLTDSQEPGKGQMRFTFPALEIAPGSVVVVFNGLNSTFTGPVGDNKTPPTGPHETFGGAYVFSMRNTNARVALGNSGDHVMLTAPDGMAIQRVWWSEDPSAAGKTATPAPAAADQGPPPIPAGKPAPKPPLIDDYAPLVTKMSVTRDGVLTSGRFVGTMDSEHVPFSPGTYKIAAAPPPPAPQPVSPSKP